MSTSDKQIEANRRNAELSTGPKSDLGKLRSSKNAVKHGIYSQTTVLFNEEQSEYDEHLQDFILRFEPQDRVELRLVQRMADCEWRLARARYIETATIDLQIDETAELVEKRFASVDEPVRVAFALQLLDHGQSATYNGVQRQETRLHRQYERSYKLLLDMRKNAPIRTAPQNEPVFTTAPAQPSGTKATDEPTHAQLHVHLEQRFSGVDTPQSATTKNTSRNEPIFTAAPVPTPGIKMSDEPTHVYRSSDMTVLRVHPEQGFDRVGIPNNAPTKNTSRNEPIFTAAPETPVAPCNMQAAHTSELQVHLEQGFDNHDLVIFRLNGSELNRFHNPSTDDSFRAAITGPKNSQRFSFEVEIPTKGIQGSTAITLDNDVTLNLRLEPATGLLSFDQR
jgi:hypothetical protein